MFLFVAVIILILGNNVESLEISSFSLGSYHGCIGLDDSSMKCWGMGVSLGIANSVLRYENIGDSEIEIGDNLPFIVIGNDTQMEKVVCGGFRSCFITTTNDMKCFGYNRYGEVGIGSNLEFIGQVSGHIGNDLPIIDLGKDIKIISVAIGEYHTCTLVTGNKVKCFGYNNSGQLGYGNNDNLGSDLSHMGDNLPFVDLGKNYKVSSIHTGAFSYHSCAIFSQPSSYSQRMKCWGSGWDFQLGYGSRDNKGENVNEMGDNLPLVDLGVESRVKQISLGYGHTCVLLINNIMKCIGEGYYGQLASGSKRDMSKTGNLIPIVKIDSGKKIKSISTGNQHTCILYDDSITFKCIGWNSYGQLGQNDDLNRGNTLSTTFDKIPAIDLGTGKTKILSIHSGDKFNCVLFVGSLVKCFGEGENGQLGIGSNLSVGYAINHMGINLKFSLLLSPTLAPTKSPTLAPSKSPVKDPCNYPNSQQCNADIKCIWGKKCGLIKCEKYKTKVQCKATDNKCKWNINVCIAV